VLVCLLRGLQIQAEVWRLIAFFGVGHLPRLPLSDQEVYDRLEQDRVSAFQAFFGQLSAWLATRLAPYEDRRLVAFATGVVALDESVLDQGQALSGMVARGAGRRQSPAAGTAGGPL
jgi:hypothetical protein